MKTQQDYENSFIEAVQTLINSSVADLAFDKTIKATICEKTADEANGRYKAKYNDSKITVFASDPTLKYRVGQQVWVSVPNGDFENDKYIVGTVDKLGASYGSSDPEYGVDIITKNLLTYASSVDLCSYQSPDSVNLLAFPSKSLFQRYDEVVSGRPEEGLANLYKEYYRKLYLIEIEGERNGKSKEEIEVEKEQYSNQFKTEKNNYLKKNTTFDNSVKNFIEQSNVQTLLKEMAISTFIIDNNEIGIHKDDSDVLYVQAVFQTALSEEQQYAQGDYGIRIDAQFYPDEERLDTDPPVTKTFYCNVPLMIGHPFKFDTPTSQVFQLPFDGKLFKRFVSITAYCADFNTDPEITQSDIFISDIQVKFGKKLTAEDLAGTHLFLSTPAGSFYNKETLDEKKYIKATVKVDGGNLPLDGVNNFLWFVKDVSIRVGDSDCENPPGEGWRLLTPQRTGNIFYVTPEMCPSRETEFLCLYYTDGDSTSYISQTVTFYNYDAKEIVIVPQDSDTTFSFKNGKVSLLALVEGEQRDDFTYYWSQTYDSDPLSSSIDNHSALLTDYSPNALNYALIQVTVKDGVSTVGSAKIELHNKKAGGDYQLVLYNADAFYQYDNLGYSPTSERNESKDRISITPITFDILTKDNTKLNLSYDEKRLLDFKWVYPDSDTMLEISAKNAASPDLEYKIAERFDINKYKPENNIIKLKVVYKGIPLEATASIYFTKMGLLGTNGTEYTVKVDVNESEAGSCREVFVNKNLICQLNEDADGNLSVKAIKGPSVHATDIVERQLIGKLYEGSTLLTPKPSETGTWGLVTLKTDISGTKTKVNNISVIGNGNSCQIDYTFGDEVNQTSSIIKYTLTGSNYSKLAKNYCGYYPIQVNDCSDYFAFVDGGYHTVMYDAAGRTPTYPDKEPFKLRLFDKASGKEISLPSGYTLTWYNSWNDEVIDNEKTNSYLPKPDNTYRDEFTDRYITCILKANGKKYYIIVSVFHYRNPYGMSEINQWTGDAMEMGDDYLLAASVGAGTKDSDNKFTGIVIGKTLDKSSKTEEGLMAYNQSERTAFIDAKTGKVTLGTSGRGQLIIDPSNTDDSVIKTNVFKKPVWSGKDLKTEGEGMCINFTDGTIDAKYFSLDKNGKIHAKDGYFEGEIKAEKGTFGGELKAATGDFTGKITAETGEIGGWIIERTNLHSRNNNVILDSSGSITARKGQIGQWYINTKGLYLGSDESSQEDEATPKILLSPYKIKFGDFAITNLQSDRGKLTVGNSYNKILNPYTGSGYIYPFTLDFKSGTITAVSGQIGAFKLTQDGFFQNSSGFQVRRDAITWHINGSRGNYTGFGWGAIYAEPAGRTQGGVVISPALKILGPALVQGDLTISQGTLKMQGGDFMVEGGKIGASRTPYGNIYAADYVKDDDMHSNFACTAWVNGKFDPVKKWFEGTAGKRVSTASYLGKTITYYIHKEMRARLKSGSFKSGKRPGTPKIPFPQK